MHFLREKPYSRAFSRVDLKSPLARREGERNRGLSEPLMLKVSRGSALFEEREIHRIGHGFVPGIVRMEVVAAVVHGQKPLGVSRIMHHRIEIDHSIVGTAGADKFVHRFTLGFALGTEVRGAFKWRERAADDFQPLLDRKSVV